MSIGVICPVCGGYIVPPTFWLGVVPPQLCKTAWPQPQGCLPLEVVAPVSTTSSTTETIDISEGDVDE